MRKKEVSQIGDSERWYQAVLGEIAYADKMFNGFFMGKLKDSVIIGFICFRC